MRILGLDLETTGLDTGTERITELGVVLWDVEGKRPLTTVGLFLIDDGIRERVKDPVCVEMMGRVCGITPALLEEFGTDAKKNLEWLERYVTDHRVEYIVAHNGEGYDRPLLLAELTRHEVAAPVLRALPWIDTRVDLPFTVEPDSRKLKHLAMDSGFLNPFAHRAVFDVLTMMRILSNYPIQDVLEYKKIPTCVARAVIPPPWEGRGGDGGKGKAWASARRYGWERAGAETFPKCWVKTMKLNQLAAEQAAAKEAGYEVVRLK